jgi:hypothetical protein
MNALPLLALLLLGPKLPSQGVVGTGAVTAGVASIDGSVLSATSMGAGTTAVGPGSMTVADTRLVVVGIAGEQLATAATYTVRWTGGTPAGASGFTRQVNLTYDDGGWQQFAEMWTATVTTSVTNAVEVVSSNVGDYSGMGIAVWRVAGAAASFVGATATSPANNTSRQMSVGITAQASGSLILGVVGNYNSATGSALSGVTGDATLTAALQIGYADHITAATVASTAYTLGHNVTSIGVKAAALEIKAQ